MMRTLAVVAGLLSLACRELLGVVFWASCRALRSVVPSGEALRVALWPYRVVRAVAR